MAKQSWEHWQGIYDDYEIDAPPSQKIITSAGQIAVAAEQTHEEPTPSSEFWENGVEPDWFKFSD